MRNYLEFAAPVLQLEPGTTLQQRLEHSESMLLRALDLGTTIAFIGSGMSVPFQYPKWGEVALRVLERALSALGSSAEKVADVTYLQSLLTGARGKKETLDSESLMFLIGAGRSTLERHGLLQEYYNYFADSFAQGRGLVGDDPYGPLLQLPIRRFVTTNYDFEIERALVRWRSVPAEDLGLARGPAPAFGRSFTQRPEGLEKLARFALAGDKGNADMVFHCHGRFDDPDSVVATEADYQRWYLGRQDGASLAFQQSIEFLLGSNPLLFIGYGLRDEDLLRPLRQLGALDPARKSSRPLFALLPCLRQNLETDQYHHQALFERFGLHVIPYVYDQDDLTSALCGKLREIQVRLKEAHREWNAKPQLKKPERLADRPAPHCGVIRATRVPIKAGEFKALEEAVHHSGVVVLVGPSGAGKSSLALRLLEPERQREFAGAFYWNAHYANEAVTAIDAALDYFDPEVEFQGTRFERLRCCLRGRRYLLILDACERLLRKSEIPGKGLSYSSTFRRLLQVITDPESQSTVVLMGRLRPGDLDMFESVRSLSLARVEARDLVFFESFQGLAEADVSALCSLLRGHSYGLHLASTYLCRCEDRSEGLRELIERLADEPRDERLCAMVFLLLERIDGGRSNGLAHAFLKRLGLFLSPVCPATVSLCSQQARESLPPGVEEIRDDAVLHEQLIEAGLLVPMRQPHTDTPAYTVHATVRASLFQPLHGLVADPLPAFGLSGFTSGRLGVDPDLKQGPQIKGLFNSLLWKAEEILATKSPEAARQLCRDAFGLIRTRMEANTAPRWCTYNGYVQLGLKVAILAKRVAPGTWTYCEHPDASRFVESPEAPLYPAELAWLYNDIAIALSAEGRIGDAYSFWEKTYEISRLIEHPSQGGGYHMEVLISLALTLIEMGRLAAASRYLDDAERLLQVMPDMDYKARLCGLRGLMAHLQGDLQGADRLYDVCLGLLESGINLRARSIFLKHKADVKIATQQFEEADLLIRNSRALAESGVFPELVANARMSEGHRLSRVGEPIKARLEYTAVLREAQRIGCRKLEVRVLTALARLALDQKDADSARDSSMRALSLANELGLSLRQSHGLVVLGLATLETGPKDLGIAYLKRAKQMADDQEYWSRSREAENKLMELGIDPNKQD